MSIARIYTTKGPVRKDGLKCGKCGVEIVKGVDRRRTFAVGFRGFEQTRCMNPSCTPSMSELESSAVASVYAAQESVDLESCQSLEDLETALGEIADSCDEVADEYESNEMYEINYDLQERAEAVRGAGDELRNWIFDGADEPQPEDFMDEDDEERDDEAYQNALDEWLTEARESAQSAIDNMDLP